jgi:hypothetical protein
LCSARFVPPMCFRSPAKRVRRPPLRGHYHQRLPRLLLHLSLHLHPIVAHLQ